MGNTVHPDQQIVPAMTGTTCHANKQRDGTDWWFRNPAFTSWGNGSLSHYLQGLCIYPRWLFGISSINSMFHPSKYPPGNPTANLCLKIRPWISPKRIWIFSQSPLFRGELLRFRELNLLQLKKQSFCLNPNVTTRWVVYGCFQK